MTMPNNELAVFCEQMHMILKAGISAYEGISIMKEDAKNKETRDMIDKILEPLEVGDTLYNALKGAHIFPDYMLQMIDIGERSGRLEDVFASLSTHYKREHELNSSIKSAISYPMIMIIMMILIIIVLMVKVLPVFENVFQQLGTGMTGVSRVFLNLGTTMSHYSYLLLGITIAIVLIGVYLTKTKKGKQQQQTLLNKGFITKKLALKLATGHFSSGMAIALSSGLDIDESLMMAEKLVTHPELKKRIEKCKEYLQEEANFSDALIKSQIFTGLYARLIQIGFKTGAMDETMTKIAQQYDEESQDQIANMVSIIEPTLVVILSIIVGLILLSVMLPLIGIMSNIG